jgi:hypothetical protein
VDGRIHTGAGLDVAKQAVDLGWRCVVVRLSVLRIACERDQKLVGRGRLRAPAGEDSQNLR